MENKSHPISESELRLALLNALRASNPNSHSLIVEEMCIDGQSARVDVALVSDTLSAFEIKSDFDNYDRLSNQIHAYNRVFEQISIVAGARLAVRIDAIVPSWWGIVVAERNAHNEIELIGRRPPQSNPMRDPYSLASLLWREEAIQLLSPFVIPENVIRKKNKAWLFDQIVERLKLEEIVSAVTAQLRLRSGWRDQRPFAPDDGSLHRVAMS
jgi:hypothetical protein